MKGYGSGPGGAEDKEDFETWLSNRYTSKVKEDCHLSVSGKTTKTKSFMHISKRKAIREIILRPSSVYSTKENTSRLSDNHWSTIWCPTQSPISSQSLICYINQSLFKWPPHALKSLLQILHKQISKFYFYFMKNKLPFVHV